MRDIEDSVVQGSDLGSPKRRGRALHSPGRGCDGGSGKRGVGAGEQTLWRTGGWWEGVARECDGRRRAVRQEIDWYCKAEGFGDLEFVIQRGKLLCNAHV